MMKKVTVISLLLFCLVIGGFAALKINSSSASRVGITAHRGDQASAPENTIPAFEAAIDYGADFIELDVTQSKDGQLVVVHDNNLERVTGRNLNVWDLEYEQMRLLDAGSYTQTYSGEFGTLRIPLLEEVLQLCKGKIKLNIELKYNGHESADFVEQVVALIKEEGFQKQCIVTSINHDFIDKVVVLDSSLKVGYILLEQSDHMERFKEADVLSVYYEIINEDMISQMHQMGKEVHVWTVNEEKDLKRCIELGVDNIITNDVRKAQSICWD